MHCESGCTAFGEKGAMEGGLGAAYEPSEQGGRTGNGNRNKEALQKLNLEDITRSLILRQIREFYYVHPDLSLMSLLKACLETGHRGRSSVVALSGCIEHFETRLEEDLGWGCGWRNIQMLSSYIIVQNTECKDALFGGAGFVPDISAMQQWLEIAWLKGFDVLGADYFDWKITGTHKWIGTTECAALLRSFGVRARLVDFRTASSKRGMDTVSKAGGAKGGGSHPNNREDTEEISGNFNQMTVSGGHSPRRATTDPTPENNSPSEEKNPSSPTLDSNDSSPEGGPVIILPDQKEELHFLRQSPEDPNICLTCVEERKHNISASQLHVVNGEEKFVDSGDSSEITAARRHAYSSAGGGGGANHADAPLNHKYMIDWIWNYFSADIGHSEGLYNFSNRSPLYFQHRGHSRTIVGIERCKKEGSNKEEDYLIVLDPSQRTRDITTALQRKQGWEDLLKRGMHTLNQAEYQLCYINPGIAKGDELESLKTLSSVRYMY